jgi:hypothetical protein
LEARVIDIRAALNASTEKASESAPDTIVAQWGNWNNWNNWAKWNNWPNWGNWGNWLNR